MLQCRFLVFLLFLGKGTVFALTQMPWFPPPLEFEAHFSVDPNFFRTVNNGFSPKDYHSNNVRAEIGLLAPITDTENVELEMTLQKSSKYSFGFESVALQGRMLFLDDLSGDPVSVDAGLNIRVVIAQRLHDVATPFHNLLNFELTSAVGKEWSNRKNWIARSYLLGGFGQANRGYPWARFSLKGETLMSSCFGLNAGFLGYFGFGPRKKINVSEFSSYAFIQHRNIDVSLGASYFFQVWGKLFFTYSYRLYAHSFPDKYQSFKVSYFLPFSL